MSRYKLTFLERENRANARAARRVSLGERVEQLREWRQARANRAAEAAREKAAARNSRPRGVDRVPAGLYEGNPLQRRPRRSNTETRQQRRQAERAAVPTQRGDDMPTTFRWATTHQRPPRRRFMPGAEARRLERNRAEWTASR